MLVTQMGVRVMSERTPDFTVSLADVAKHAGVSAATASKALNGKFDVNAITRSRVEAAARELGYQPNSLARGLMGAKTGTVGVITSDLEGRFALPILMGVEDELGTERVLTFLCDARGDKAREGRLVRALLARQVDGVIVVGRQNDERDSLGPLPVPVVYAYAFSSDPADLSVTVDNVQVGRAAAAHIAGTGRRQIAHISGDFEHGAARDRSTGIREFLAERGIPTRGETMFGDWSEGWGRAAAQRVLEQTPATDAIICASDQLARGALDLLATRGVSVPQEIAVMGVDNWAVIAENARPTLTTIDLQLEYLGRVAARQLQSLSAGEHLSGVQRLPGALVIRDSTIPRL